MLKMALMRQAVEEQVPSWTEVTPSKALPLGLEVLSGRNIEIDRDLLLRGILLIAGKNRQEIIDYSVHLLAHLRGET
jgi:hypothetical protein